MNSRDRALAEASKVFIGFVQVGNTDTYLEYQVKGVTRKSVKLRLKKVVSNLNEDELQTYTMGQIFCPDDTDVEVFRKRYRIIGERKTTV